MHTNLLNNKKYIGITSVDPNIRWENGRGYSQNEKFFSDILRYGWDNFSHEILFDNLSHKDAINLEREYIEKYDTTNNGYNISSGQYNEHSFDYYNYTIFNDTNFEYKKVDNRFVMIPNIFIKQNLKKTYSLDRVFLFVYFAIGRNRTLDDRSYVTVQNIIYDLGYKPARHKPKAVDEIIKSLLFLRDNNYIDCDFNVKKLKYNDCIDIKIIAKNFFPRSNFTILYFDEFDMIKDSNSSIGKANLLLIYLYVKSFIFGRQRDDNGNEIYSHPEKYPESFYRSIENIKNDLSMSKDTVVNCLAILSDDTGDCNLLIKEETKRNPEFKNYSMNNVPNIYVLNHNKFNQEIDWTVEKMKNFFKPNFIE